MRTYEARSIAEPDKKERAGNRALRPPGGEGARHPVRDVRFVKS